jgi:hypothetical protein
MDVEESLSRVLYKEVIVAIKVIPILIATLFLVRSILSCIDVDVTWLSYLCGMSLIPLLFMYLVSYAFKFCTYHRMFLHYIVVNDAINYIDYYIGIPLQYHELLRLHIIIAGIFLLLIIYYHQKWKKEQRNILLNS